MNNCDRVAAKLVEHRIESHRATLLARRLMITLVNRHRLVLLFLGLALAVVTVGAIIFAPSGKSMDPPEAVEAYSPEANATVLRQIYVEIDLPVDYEITLVIDGVTIPSDEIQATEETGKFRWRPDETTIIPEWTPGLHTVWVRWDRVSGLPDPGEWIWTFRVQ